MDCRPYPIVVGSVMTPERQVSPKFFPFEFTPLYVGMPSVADYTKPTALGGGYVEPIGFNTLAPRRKVVSKSGNEVRRQPVFTRAGRHDLLNHRSED
jgi:hypothetical protein